MRGVAFAGDNFIRGVAFAGDNFIRGGGLCWE